MFQLSSFPILTSLDLPVTGDSVSLQSPKFSWGNSNPQFLLVWLYLEIGSLQMYDEIDGVYVPLSRMTGVWCHYRKREVWTQKLTHRKNRRHKDTLDWLYTFSWWKWLGCTVVSELWALWATSLQCLEFQMLHQGRHRGKAFPGLTFRPSSQEQVFSAFWQQYPNHCNKHVLTKDILHQERTPDQNLPLGETSNQYAHWMDWLFPTNPDHSLIVYSRGHHYFGPSESDCSHLHLEHQPGPADGGGESRYTVITTMWALTEC